MTRYTLKHHIIVNAVALILPTLINIFLVVNTYTCLDKQTFFVVSCICIGIGLLLSFVIETINMGIKK